MLLYVMTLDLLLASFFYLARNFFCFQLHDQALSQSHRHSFTLTTASGAWNRISKLDKSQRRLFTLTAASSAFWTLPGLGQSQRHSFTLLEASSAF